MLDDKSYIGIFKSLKHSDQTIVPFKTYKSWNITDKNYYSESIRLYKGAYPDDRQSYRINSIPIGTELANLYEYKTPYGTLAKVAWNAVNHLFYKRYNSGVTHGGLDPDRPNQYLYESASIVYLPQNIIGEGIKRQSINISDNSLYNIPNTLYIKDDGCGNLYDNSIDSSSFMNWDNCVGYWGFNEKYTSRDRNNNWPVQSYSRVKDLTRYGQHLSCYDVKFEPGITTTGASNVNSGMCVSSVGTGSIYIPEPEHINFNVDENFGISLWVKLPTNQPNSIKGKTHLISKQGDVVKKRTVGFIPDIAGLPNNIGNESYLAPYNGVVYPYDIHIVSDNTSPNFGKIVCSKKDVDKTPTNISTSTLNDNSWHHIVYTKSGSALQLYIDGVLESTVTDTTRTTTNNNACLNIGCYNLDPATSFSGSIDEVRFYNVPINSDNVLSLANNDFISGTAYNTSACGHVFYSMGVIIVTSPQPRYNKCLLGQTGTYDFGSNYTFNLGWKSTQTLYEYEYVCRVNEGEYNFTMNPTIRKNNDSNNPDIKDFVTGSAFTPYITTIGLYNSDYQLLAIGKLSNPLPKRPDVDTTIIVKFDI